MVDPQVVEKQLKKLKFDGKGFNKPELNELPNILVEGEEMYELANGYYEGGFALLVATNVRILLIDKKPLNFLTVEDLRFDTINEIDYNHRLFGAQITMTSGSKTLKFRSYNQQRLRKLITHIQHCMAQNKIQQGEQQNDQKEHLEQINHQLQAYLIAQHQQQMQMQQHMQQQAQGTTTAEPAPEPVKPSPELSDFLYAQGLLAEYRAKEKQQAATPLPAETQPAQANMPAAATDDSTASEPSPAANTDAPKVDLYAAGRDEIFKKPAVASIEPVTETAGDSQPHVMPEVVSISQTPVQSAATSQSPLDVNPLRIAYSKLPMAMRNRKFGRPSFHSHSQASDILPQPTSIAES